MCQDGNHNLEVIYTSVYAPAGDAEVVRWCSSCGAVVVDIDVDNRVMQPGGVEPMRFPDIVHKYNQLLGEG